MVRNEFQSPADYIEPLRMNKLQGRMLRLPAPKNKSKEILLLYGHHSTIERWWGIALNLNKYGAVTMPDLPGFGGMQSFYSIGQRPTLDAMADYLAAFVKLRYARRRLTIVAMSFGFVVATRMLQRYPDLAKRVDMIVSVAGFCHYQDFRTSKQALFIYRPLARLVSTPLPSFLFRITLQPPIIRAAYTYSGNAKFRGLNGKERNDTFKAEYKLWHANDVRTHFYTLYSMISLDNCRQYVKAPVWHVTIKGDQYLNGDAVEQHMRVIFSDYHQAEATLKIHAPTMLTDKATAAAYIPSAVRRALS